ncbi:hypothetical protein [Kingella potus]|uniref:hypothetical protein n=1 Tax=Kingella potus TaxID=265175 RepID=UPI001FD0976B|nr:hypothetical protein [Kingella potus]UOP00497.1 hypothetical protein LVJ84_11695 [Kingella potus]
MEYAVILHDVLSCKDPQTLAAFQKLLAQSWHERHEDIVMLLAGCPHESSLPHLVRAFAFDPPYAGRYPLQKKIMWAVYRIAGGKRGAEILQPLAQSYRTRTAKRIPAVCRQHPGGKALNRFEAV